jgi:hypothetical protein
MAPGLRLNRWAFDVPVGTEHAAVSGLGLEHRAARSAVVIILARIRRHRFSGPVAAMRAGNGGLQDHGYAYWSISLPVMAEGHRILMFVEGVRS